MTYACVSLLVFFELFLFHEIMWIKDQKVHVISWNKKEQNHSELEITWVDDVSIAKLHEIKNHPQILIHIISC